MDLCEIGPLISQRQTLVKQNGDKQTMCHCYSDYSVSFLERLSMEEQGKGFRPESTLV